MRMERIGRLTVSAHLDRDSEKLLQEHLFILDKVFLFYSNEIEYIANNDAFDEIAEGDIIPSYRVIVHTLNHIHFQGVFLTFERLNNENGIYRAG